MRNVPIVAALLFYLLALTDLTLFEYPLNDPTPNLVPFRTILSDLSGAGPGLWTNFAANLILLTPLGILLPALNPRRIGWKSTALACLVVSLAIEVAQYLGGSRVADVDDVLLNVLSGQIGYAMFAAALELLGIRRDELAPAGDDDEDRPRSPSRAIAHAGHAGTAGSPHIRPGVARTARGQGVVILRAEPDSPQP